LNVKWKTSAKDIIDGVGERGLTGSVCSKQCSQVSASAVNEFKRKIDAQWSEQENMYCVTAALK